MGKQRLEVEASTVVFDKLRMVDTVISIENFKAAIGEPYMSKSDCLNIFNVSLSNYQAWVKRQESRRTSKGQSMQDIDEAWKRDQDRILEIVKELSYCPGVKTMRQKYFRKYKEAISMKRVRKLMRSLRLTACKRKRDAYKHQATHNHPFAAPAGNIVNQEFYLGPRRIVCTDITYLYYGKERKVYYWCCFKDPFTEEILGHASGKKMDTDLIKRAYEMMMKTHGQELKNAMAVVHSDQGSQYCSATFQELLSNDGLIQSMSRRGNSLDNSPMESFFGLSKSIILDIFARCPDAAHANALLNGFVDMYNNKRPQAELAGLCPSEFYLYSVTGVYPLDNYFGVPASELRTLEALRNDKDRFADEEARKRREAYAEAKAKAAQAAPLGLVNPQERVQKDRQHINKLLYRTRKKLADVQEDQIRYEIVSSLILVAEEFIHNASADILKDLRNPEHWKDYPELTYIYEMDEMF